MNEELLQEVKKDKNLKENESIDEPSQIIEKKQKNQMKSAVYFVDKPESDENNVKITKYMKDDDDLRYFIRILALLN